MFDDRLQDIILSEMMAAFGADVRTDEGSLAFNACAKIAEKLEEIYGDMDELNDNLLPDTMDDSHLIEYGSERGLSYEYATAPIVKGVFQQEIEIGETFTCSDYVYEVVEKLADFEYKMQCDTEGTEANTTLGELEPVDYIDDYLGGTITEIIVPGSDDQDIEEYRQKVIDTFRSQAFGGNRADYKRYINAIKGVGGCKPKRREQASPWVNIYVIGADYGVPSSTLISDIQTAVDPAQNHGEGDGMAPICHNVMIYGVESVEVSISTSVTFDSGYSVTTSGESIKKAINAYLHQLREHWEDNGFNDTVVRVRQIEAAVLTVEGVLDVSFTTVNGDKDNLSMDYSKIPILGEVTLDV